MSHAGRRDSSHRSGGGPGQKEQHMPGITVGVDGSHNSQQALRWAMKEAALQHAPLTVLTVHEVAANHWTGNPMIEPGVDQPEQEKYRQAAEEAVAKIASELGGSGPASVTVRAVSGFAAQELIDASHDSDLVVVGARGGGGFARLMLGSITNKVVHHAACPVVIVPVDR
jgi:nucleotide-binding universal stress UspA family protein